MKYLFIVVLLIFTGCKNEVKKENIKVVENSRVDYLPYYNDESFTPHWLTPNTEEEKAFHKIPDFSLTNQSGETVTQDTFEDKIYVTDFFFTTCPGICPKMTGNMAKIQEEFKNDQDVLLLSHSVMPSTDSVSVLRAYANKNDVIDNKTSLLLALTLEVKSSTTPINKIKNNRENVKKLFKKNSTLVIPMPKSKLT